LFRRKRALVITGVAVLSIAITAALLAAQRHKSRFDYLYALGPSVAEYKPSPHYVVFGYPTLPVSGSRRSYPGPVFWLPEDRLVTVLVFGPEQKVKVRGLLMQHSTGAISQVAARSGSGVSLFQDGRVVVTLAVGTDAEVQAGDARLAFPTGGCVVKVSEPPDWFTARIDAMLRALHLR
jgi:hypothetical protein